MPAKKSATPIPAAPSQAAKNPPPPTLKRKTLNPTELPPLTFAGEVLYKAHVINTPRRWEQNHCCYKKWTAFAFKNARDLRGFLQAFRFNENTMLCPHYCKGLSLIVPYEAAGFVWPIIDNENIDGSTVEYCEVKYWKLISDELRRAIGKPGKKPTQGYYRYRNPNSTTGYFDLFIPIANLRALANRLGAEKNAR